MVTSQKLAQHVIHFYEVFYTKAGHKMDALTFSLPWTDLSVYYAAGFIAIEALFKLTQFKKYNAALKHFTIINTLKVYISMRYYFFKIMLENTLL